LLLGLPQKTQKAQNTAHTQALAMAEVIYTFAEPFDADGLPYAVRVCGRPTQTVWEGWLEFVGANGETLVTPRETTQPDREALEYWATGLSPTYFEGAFVRAMDAEEDAVLEDAEAIDQEPAAAPAERSAATSFDAPPVARGAVLDPYSVASKGEDLLRNELLALSDWHLRNIIRAYDLADRDADLDALSAPALVELIVGAVIPA
jgi:hypothetical protein